MLLQPSLVDKKIQKKNIYILYIHISFLCIYIHLWHMYTHSPYKLNNLRSIMGQSDHFSESETSIFNWFFQLDDSKSSHGKWLDITKCQFFFWLFIKYQLMKSWLVVLGHNSSTKHPYIYIYKPGSWEFQVSINPPKTLIEWSPQATR